MEQISVLEMDREISGATMARYLPQENNFIPTLYHSGKKEEDGFSERDILYKVLFDMKKDMNDLKKLVHRVLQHESFDDQIIEDHRELFTDMDKNSIGENFHPKPNTFLLENKKEPEHLYELGTIEESQDEIEDITHETEPDESLSIQEKEKELIIKALRKNNNKRKYAAQDLGISERTLYRKINQYGIEE